MKISSFGTIQSAPPPAVKAGNLSGASSFASLLSLSDAHDTTHTATLSDVGAASLANMLAFQEVSDEDANRKKMLHKGKSLLEVLEKLRRQLLIGTMPLGMLQDLNRQLAVKKQFIADPALTELIEDIELRAGVELAKLEMAMAQQAEPS